MATRAGTDRATTTVTVGQAVGVTVVSSRLATAVAGVLVGLAISLAAWAYFDTPLLSVLVPFVPFLFRGGRFERRPDPRRCPVCGFATRDPSFDYCPRDGTELD